MAMIMGPADDTPSMPAQAGARAPQRTPLAKILRARNSAGEIFAAFGSNAPSPIATTLPADRILGATGSPPFQARCDLRCAVHYARSLLHATSSGGVEMTRRGLTYQQLAEALEKIGVKEDKHNLRNRIAWGKFTAAFFLQCLGAIGCQTMRLEDF
jgi:hypothetical protein